MSTPGCDGDSSAWPITSLAESTVGFGHSSTDFYKHNQNWTNRMFLGDPLQVMASLAERKGLRGKVQCIYIDPPYGIKSGFLTGPDQSFVPQTARSRRSRPQDVL